MVSTMHVRSLLLSACSEVEKYLSTTLTVGCDYDLNNHCQQLIKQTL